jgi:multiple sugar transport system ATP-binding protein
MRKEIRALHDRLGATSVYVTHDQIEAMTMADHVVVMRDGIVEQQGPPLELYDRPANRFVAGFIGSPAMNFVEVVVGADGRSLAFGNEALPLDRQLQPGTELTAGLRPEHLRITEVDSQFHIVVGVVESTGSATYISSRDEAITVVQTSRSSAAPGDVMGLSIDPAVIHLFDKRTGDRV